MRELALLIPDEERRFILENNYVGKAIGIIGNKEMDYLFKLWKYFIEPSVEASCNACYERILKNYKQLVTVLIDLEKESNTLKSI